MESFGTFRPEKQDYLLRYSITPANFRWNDPESRVPFTFQPRSHRKLSEHFVALRNTSEHSQNTWKQHRNNSENLETGG